MLDRILLEEIYFNLLEEGIEQKIPKLLNLVKHIPEYDRADYIRGIAAEFDPTPSADYITWILKMLRTNIFRREDGERCRESLETFTRLKKLPAFPKEKRDINSYKSWGDLAETMEPFSGVQSKKEVFRAAREEGIELMEEVDTGYKTIDANYKLYVVTSEEAAAKHFRTTSWCVKAPNMFNNYGPPYYYFTRNDEPFTLIHLDSNQCMDTYDRPKKLKPWERDMMETEKMTDYVLKNDGGDNALDFYVQKVGSGHDDKICVLQQQKMEELINSYDLKHLDINSNDNYDDEYFDLSASGFMPYDFSNMNYDDKKFQKIVRDALGRVNIYMEYLESDNIQDDGVSFYLQYDYQSDYQSTTRMDKTKSFLNDLYNIDKGWDNSVEEFGEFLTQTLMEKGFIGGDYSTFLEKYLPRANFRIFKQTRRDTGEGAGYKEYDNLWMSPFIQMDIDGMETINIGGYSNRGSRLYWRSLHLKHAFSEHPLVILSKFLTPLTPNQLRWGITDGGTIGFKYNVEYDEDMTLKDYVNDLKMAISIDRHWEEYKQQISDFWNKYVLPTYMTGADESGMWNIPNDLKIPIIHIYGRKESPGQMHLDLRERKKFNYMLKRLKILNG